MRKNGFTLIELLATIFVLGLLMTIVAVSSVEIIKDANNKAYRLVVDKIETASREYAVNYSNILTTLTPNNTVAYITLEDLQTKELVSTTLVDPRNDEEIPSSAVVKVTREEDGTVKYEFLGDSNLPTISLIGSSVVVVEVGSTYNETGAIAYDYQRNNISSSIVIGGTVNANVIGTYILSYDVTDTYGNRAITAYRTVEVVAVENPVVAFTPNGNITYAKSYSTKVEVTDNGVLNQSSLKYQWTTSTTTPSEGSFVNTFANGTMITTPFAASGSYYLWVLARDSMSNTTVARSNVFNIDGQDPTVAFGTNGSSTYTKSNSTKVTVTDNIGVNTSSLKYQWTTSTNPPAESSFSTTFTNEGTISTLAGVTGSYYLWIFAKDTTGNVNIFRSESFNLDNTIPEITLLGSNPVMISVGQVYSDAGATASDNINGNITSNIVTNNPVNTNVAGTYTVTYNVSDALGNAALQVTRTVYVQLNQPPTIAFGTNGNPTYAASYSTTVTASDADGIDTNNLKYQWTNSTTAPTEGSFTTTFTNGASISSTAGLSGSYYLWILAKDTLGNTIITNSNVFNLDNASPTVAFSPNGDTTFAKARTTEVTVSDSLSGISSGSLKYQWTNSTTAPTEGSFTTTFTNGASISSTAGLGGSYYLWILAKDTALNTTITRSEVFNLDNMMPSFAFVTNGNTTYAATQSTFVNVTDSGSGVDPNSLKYQWNTSTSYPTEASFTTTFTNGDNISSTSGLTGGYYLWILGKDMAGNTRIGKSNIFNIDNTLPTVVFGTNGNTAYATSYSSTVTVSDAHSGVNASSLKYQWTKSTNAPIETSFSTTFTSGGSVTSPSGATGGYYLWILAKDSAGNTIITRTNVFNLDNLGPTVTFGTNGKSTYAISYSTTVTLSDANVGLNPSSLEYQWTTSTDAPAEGTFSTPFSNGASISTPALSGGYYLWILGKDTLGNTTITRSNVFNIDNAAPSVTFNPNGNSTPASSYSTVVTISDANSGVNASSLKYQWTTSTSSPAEGTFSTTFTSGSTINSPGGVTGNYYLWILAKDILSNTTITRSDTFALVASTDYIDSEGVNKPRLHTGMTAIKWNGSSWDNVADPANDTSWYNYANKEWANAKTADGSYWVWIPRYAYQIATNYHTNTAGTINVKFLKNNTDVASDNTTVATTPTYSGSSQTNYIRHPGFTFGTLELTGIWVAKFEADGNDNLNAIRIIPDGYTNSNDTVGDQFTACRNMETTNGTQYGWGTSGTGIDTHMMKNTEWGMVAYLAQSTFGKNAEVWINPDYNYLTGRAGTSVNASETQNTYTYSNATYGVNASTTGNVYGIYDMNGGVWEYVAAYVNNGQAVGASSLLNADAKYKDVYTVGSPDAYGNNYAANSSKKGDAVYETSSQATDSSPYSWYGDGSYMPYSSNPVFCRGGDSGEGSQGGLYHYSYWDGSASSWLWDLGFRPVLAVDSSL